MGCDKQMKYVLDCYITQFLLTNNQFSKEWISSLPSQKVVSSLVLCTSAVNIRESVDSLQLDWRRRAIYAILLQFVSKYHQLLAGGMVS